MSEIEKEIERLQMKKIELVNKMNSNISLEEKEESDKYLDIIQRQINILEAMMEKKRISSR